MQYKLSILIPARSEEFLINTVQDLLENKTDDTQILIGLDGEWSTPIPDHKDITIFYVPVSIGQRKMQNQLCRLAKGKYIMKLDAHCKVDEHFDKKMLDAFDETGDNVVMIPNMKNLWVFDWVCEKCGDRRYQGQTPRDCPKCDNKTKFKKDIIWIAKKGPNSTAYRFDTKLHFQYHGEWKKKQKGDLVESMSLQGSAFMMTRKKYWELGVCDENHGSWGQQAVEIACAVWLSGGKVIINKRTFYGHLFRTAGGDFSFPYPQSGQGVQNARKYSQDLWLNNKHPKQIYPLSWLINKFKPLPDWHEKSGIEMLKKVNQAGEEFYKVHNKKEEKPLVNNKPTKSIIYYTDNKLNLKIARLVQSQLKTIGLPLVSASLKPMPHFGENIHLPLKRGFLTMFKQILAALEASTSDIIFHCEHDMLYPKEHFDFTPPKKDVFYYNLNVFKVNMENGNTLKVDVCRQVSGLCGYRELLIDEYKKRVEFAEGNDFKGRNGYEPGTKSVRSGGFSDSIAEDWESEVPILDLRHEGNLTRNRWRKDQFRNQKNTIGWTEDVIENLPGWDISYLRNIIEK